MTAAGWVALALAIFGAFSYAAGSILQAVGAQRSTGTVRTLGHPLYLLGVACDLLAWAGSMVALRELAVYQVQSVLAGSLALTVIGARLILASRLRIRDVVAVVVTIAALTVLAMSAGPQEEVAASSRLRLGFCVAALAAALAGWGATKVASPGVVAALAGLCFGGAALSGRALALPAQPTEHLSAAGLAIVTEPLAAALLVFAATGMLLYTNALQHGQVGPVTAVLWIGEVVAPSAVGLALLGDTVRPGWELRAAVAGLITVGAAVVLATAPATGATAQPSPDRPPEVRARCRDRPPRPWGAGRWRSHRGHTRSGRRRPGISRLRRSRRTIGGPEPSCGGDRRPTPGHSGFRRSDRGWPGTCGSWPSRSSGIDTGRSRRGVIRPGPNRPGDCRWRLSRRPKSSRGGHGPVRRNSSEDSRPRRSRPGPGSPTGRRWTNRRNGRSRRLTIAGPPERLS